MNGGKTAHSLLQIPIDTNNSEVTVCNITKGSARAQLIKESKILFWDEISMIHRYAVEAVNTSFKDIRNNGQIMGDMLVVLAGDFRQTLPLVRRGTMADEIGACLKSSKLWKSINCFELKMNMRIDEHDTNANSFAQYLLKIGNGTQAIDCENRIKLNRRFFQFAKDIEDLIETIYSNLNNEINNIRWISERAILSTKNSTVDEINYEVLQLLKEKQKVYYSIDRVIEDDDTINYPTEFLNTLTPSGLPPYKLILKKGAPVILLRNLNPPMLCNGTRMIIKQMSSYVIETTIVSGTYEGQTVLVPRIPLCTNGSDIQFKRLQFPIKLAYAITINKSQGQSFNTTGVDLREEVFGHGQLYVAMSRARSSDELYILINKLEHKTKNIVYKKILSK